MAAGCDGSAPLASRTQPIRAGSAASDAAVVALGAAPVGCSEALDVDCTGTLIAPRAILTAAHCARLPGHRAVFVGDDVMGPGEVHDVVMTIVHPSYVEGEPGADLAVLVLATTPNVTPLALSNTPIEVGRTVRAVGFGAIDEMGTGTGIRREGFATVDVVTSPVFRSIPAPGLTCAGDSGGPLLIGDLVVGVTSQGDIRCETYADNIDVAAYGTFIADAVTTAMAWTPTGEGAASCTPSCTTDDDCAIGLECEVVTAGDAQGLCVRAPLSPGTLAGDCTRDEQCADGTCARVPGEQACRCHVPCDVASDGGCSAGSRPSLAVFALLFGRRRRRHG